MLEGPGEVIEMTNRIAPGSAHSVTSAELERFEHNDIHKVLAAVPGVYIREEDGYGLRPNIGMRGSGSERSAKIALMEDGILIAPAPYAAPAAYYFPLVTRMERVEVLKGPAAIKYGPNTVGGAVNLISRQVPRSRAVEIDLAGGSDLYGKAHGTYAETSKHFAVMTEMVRLRTDGFKEIDGGGETGFDKNDLNVSMRANTDPVGATYHQVDLKFGYADEVSNETYTGLSDADFDAAPYRRYSATRLDRMTWDHVTLRASHRVELAGNLDVTTTLYRHDFSRSWTKLNGFDSDRSLRDILADPMAGNNAVFYSVLTGESDSISPDETLLIGTNARDFVSQGIQLVSHAERRWSGTLHDLELGIRYHRDDVERHHTEEGFLMMTGDLVRDTSPTEVTRDVLGTSEAWAVYLQDKITYRDVTMTAGLRTEVIDNTWVDRADGGNDYSDSYAMVIPGGGAVYRATSELSLLAGVYRGFVPVSPGSGVGIDPEESINYEAGARLSDYGMYVETIGFFNDYKNLKGMCTISSGCSTGQVDDEFNGGAVHVYGAELLAASEPKRGTLHFPLKLAYTFTHSSFRSSFTSDNPQWGDVSVGDELPYLPAHQLTVQAGIGGDDWEFSASGRFNSSMRDIAGNGDVTEDQRTDAFFVVDLAANYDFGDVGIGYVTVGNLLDRANIVSRRPYGARPSAPRLIIFGYKNAL